jgi:hypothetical protein
MAEIVSDYPDCSPAEVRHGSLGWSLLRIGAACLQQLCEAANAGHN